MRPVCRLFQDNIVLIGHSAGAHLCALTTLFLIDTREELFIEASKQRGITHAIRGVIGKDDSTLHQKDPVMVAIMFNAKEKSVSVNLVNVCHKDDFKLLNFCSFFLPLQWLLGAGVI